MIIELDAAIGVLAAAQVVAYPTETVYGLGADATSESAIDALRDLKGRAASRGMSVLVSDWQQLEGWESELPACARQLAARFWPGPLTLVIPSRDSRWRHVATEAGVGFRCSSHPVARALAARASSPLVSTSANRSGDAPCRNAAEVEKVFGEKLAILEGSTSNAAPSTVISLHVDRPPELLREGAIRFNEVMEVISA